MPRGVPNSGARKPRAASTQDAEVDPFLASSAVDEALGVGETPEVEVPPEVLAPTANVTEYPDPEERPELTPQEKEIQQLRDQLAKLSGKKDPELEYDEPASDGEVIQIHFLEDGLTVNGRVMYRGEELEFVVGGRAYKDTFNRRGQTWLDLRNDEFAQVDRFGKIMFRNGPWPGKTYLDGAYENLRQEKGDGTVRPPTEEELAAAEKARKKRAAPRLPSQV